MSDITIKPLTESDAVALFQFELENREFFESMVPSRGDSYYDFGNFMALQKEIVKEQKEGSLYMYLIKDQEHNIIGRVNLVSIVRGMFNKAELGYRIGKAYTGKGYTTKAVALVLHEAIHQHKLHRIEAGTAPDNIGSQIVLIKNGFQFTGRNHKYIYQNGAWQDSISFEKILDETN
ncbi:ribosomal-protein-alanine N-acetyltransferase [Anaerosolibacter carboniphilus]|uniref:Ribosomal-protein-alanine N-acetyltransferase n=1 Tax=Anaerosolibacter carboniphilus TaxID=1417629 RepID=A0A841KYR0_9FIRM|nr:GNAT family protein [Anaerosolibacter carboniphilus]MBB6218764.1 ribosomal-protein-alanine N-acetyltransferase [Anaerosolibacter carboniphilus]